MSDKTRFRKPTYVHVRDIEEGESKTRMPFKILTVQKTSPATDQKSYLIFVGAIPSSGYQNDKFNQIMGLPPENSELDESEVVGPLDRIQVKASLPNSRRETTLLTHLGYIASKEEKGKTPLYFALPLDITIP